MQLLKLKETINFMKLRLPAMVLSTVLILGSLVSLGPGLYGRHPD